MKTGSMIFINDRKMIGRTEPSAPHYDAARQQEKYLQEVVFIQCKKFLQMKVRKRHSKSKILAAKVEGGKQESSG